MPQIQTQQLDVNNINEQGGFTAFSCLITDGYHGSVDQASMYKLIWSAHTAKGSLHSARTHHFATAELTDDNR